MMAILLELHQLIPIRLKSLGVGALAGVLMHLGFFIRGELHVHAPQILLVHALSFVCSFVGGVYYGKWDHSAVFFNAIAISISYCVTLFTSITLYRLIFHRLARARFPGPIGARITKLWHVWACRGSKNHLVLAGLKRKYGDFVRTGEELVSFCVVQEVDRNIGPSEVTIFHPDVFSMIDGPKTNCIKSEWYDILHPNLSLVTSRIKAIHQARRRQWNRGFSASGKYLAALLSEIHESDVLTGDI